MKITGKRRIERLSFHKDKDGDWKQNDFEKATREYDFCAFLGKILAKIDKRPRVPL